jgi:hypothetical protein
MDRKIWKPFCHDKPSTYLMQGTYVEYDVTQLQNLGTDVEFILARYTSKLQVLDVDINKPFKDYLRSAYEDFMVSNAQNKVPSRLIVSQWILTA